MSNPNNPADAISIQADTLALKEKARQEGLDTIWERFEAQKPQCGFCELGLSCRICVMGPCRIDPFGDGPQLGVCGADADIMVARNLGRMVAAGAASHSDHGRDLVETLLAVGEGKAPGFQVTDGAKLDRLAAEFGVPAELSTQAKAKEARQWAEKIITLAKRGDLHARRQTLQVVRTKKAMVKLFGELKERYQDRPGGYTRIIPLGFRVGDGAPVSILELVGRPEKLPKAKKKASAT